MVFLSPPNSNGLAVSTFQAWTNPPLTRALASSLREKPKEVEGPKTGGGLRRKATDGQTDRRFNGLRAVGTGCTSE